VTAAIAVAGSLGLPVSAPEVTSPEQLAMLIALGCDRVQGDLLWPKLQPDDVQAALGHSAAG
jgi:EAL domain-containing protein (putative c-di-GMP-specific phosphodiesterase class I)